MRATKAAEVLGIAAAVVAWAGALSAQSVSSFRSGFFVSGGLGLGSAGLGGDAGGGDREKGLSGYLRIGGTLNPHVRLGFESNGWVKSDAGMDAQMGFWSAAAYYYPSNTNNFWLKGGLGIAGTKFSGGGDDLTSIGLGLSAGAGYDVLVSGHFAIVPFIGYLHQVSGEAKLNSVGLGGSMHGSVLQFGFGLGYKH
jgi:hypothetical protein